MADKPLIINEVDVSTCSEQGETISGITCGNGSKIRLADRYIYKYKLCKDNPNCLFKQLARKTQEVEELKKQLADFMNGEYCANGCAKMRTHYKEYHYKLIEEIDQLKAENEKWQKEYWELEKGNDFLAEENSKLRAENDELKNAKKNSKRS